MKKRNPLRRLAALVAAVIVAAVVVLPLSAPAQQIRIPAEALQSDEQLLSLLQTGQELEREHRWGEALSHYEDALREFPDHVDLQQRVSRTRIHWDLARRYADRSYVRSIQQLGLDESLNLYDEVLTKIDTYYVQPPNWREIVSRGTTALEHALADDVFVQHHLARADGEAISKFRQELHRHLDWRGVRDRREARSAVNVAARLAQAQLGLSSSAVVLEYICGAAGTLDSYSSYLTEAQLTDVFSQIEGNFVGLGIELKADNGSLLLVNVIEGSPAAKAGIKVGDRIVAVDGKSTEDVSTDKAADLLKGPEGSTVAVTLVTAADTGRVVRVRRERVEVPSVEDVKIVDRQYGIAYLRISSFQKTTIRDLDAALWKLHRAGMRSLIIDVRGNPGGLLNSSVEAADKFVQDGTIVSTRGRSAREDFDYSAHRVGTWRVPLFVLIDGDSASAAEIFAGAIRDHRRGVVIGQRSYGKGSVQGIFSLGIAGAGVRLTTAKFYSPSGQAICKRGVQPDLVVRMTAKPEGDEIPSSSKDAILTAGIEAAKQQISQR